MNQTEHDRLDEALAAFRRMEVPAVPPDTSVLARLNGAEEIPAPVSAASRRSRLLCFAAPSAAAAVIGIAGLALWLFHNAAPLALADVVTAAKKHKLVRYHERHTTDAATGAGACLDSVVYADFTAPRLFRECRKKDADGDWVRLSVHDGKRHLTTDSRQKTATLDRAPKDYKSVLCCLEDFQQKTGVTQENVELDGHPAVRCRHSEGRQTITVWVNPKSKLPVRIEHESMDPKPGITRITVAWTDFAWDPELPKGFRSLHELFSTSPPSGYILDDRTKSRKP